jgi:hypothetical protein
MVRLVAALVEGESPYHTYCQHGIEPALVAEDKQWGEYEVMDYEDEQIYPEMPPYHPYLLPVKSQGAVVDGADIEAHQWRCEEKSPQRHVGHVFVFRLFLHPFHITDFFVFYCVYQPPGKPPPG